MTPPGKSGGVFQVIILPAVVVIATALFRDEDS